jgi:hypothetical protein
LVVSLAIRSALAKITFEWISNQGASFVRTLRCHRGSRWDRRAGLDVRCGCAAGEMPGRGGDGGWMGKREGRHRSWFVEMRNLTPCMTPCMRSLPQGAAERVRRCGWKVNEESFALPIVPPSSRRSCIASPCASVCGVSPQGAAEQLARRSFGEVGRPPDLIPFTRNFPGCRRLIQAIAGRIPRFVHNECQTCPTRNDLAGGLFLRQKGNR